MFRSSLMILSILWFPLAHAQFGETSTVIEAINRSPVFSVPQNSPALAEFYTKLLPEQKGVTDLCIPASMADLLLAEAQNDSEILKALKLSSLADLDEVSTSQVVKSLIDTCHFEPHSLLMPKGSISWAEGAACLQQIHATSSSKTFSVTYIRPDYSGVDSVLIRQGVAFHSRAPKLADLTGALSRQAQVIAILSFQKWDETRQTWSISSTHSVNIFGYAREAGATPDQVLVYLQNSNRNYYKNGVDPVFDVAEMNLQSDILTPARSSSIEITTRQGRLLNFPGLRTFLTGLVIVEQN